jgi:hypothetical protein
MAGGSALPYRRRVRLQLRASSMHAPWGATYWSDAVQLDALGGAAVVSVPCPAAGPAHTLPDPRAAYMLTVTANQVLAGALKPYIANPNHTHMAI